MVKTSVIRRYGFEAAHDLPWHPGKCRELHGHSYKLEVSVSGAIDRRGVVLDFAEVDAIVEPVVQVLDHSYLNRLLENPTAERVTEYIAAQLDENHLQWSSITLWETSDGGVRLER
jgi:6-pyruvoyltetrahydropterin/6-carboxytetrahydropterin synthase